jgi:hypothetical protein
MLVPVAVLNQTAPGVPTGLHAFIENAEVAEQHLADGTPVGQPFLAVA